MYRAGIRNLFIVAIYMAQICTTVFRCRKHTSFKFNLPYWEYGFRQARRSIEYITVSEPEFLARKMVCGMSDYPFETLCANMHECIDAPYKLRLVDLFAQMEHDTASLPYHTGR